MAKKGSRSVRPDVAAIRRLREQCKLKTTAMLLEFLGVRRSRMAGDCVRPASESADLSPGTVSKILDGKRVDVSSMQEFAKPFGVDYRELIADEPAEAPDPAAALGSHARASSCKKVLFVDDESTAWLLDAYQFAVLPQDPKFYYATRGEVDIARSKVVRLDKALTIPSNDDLPAWFADLAPLEEDDYRFVEITDTEAQTRHLNRQYELRLKRAVLEEAQDTEAWVASVVAFRDAFRTPDWFTVLRFFGVDHLVEELRIGPLMTSARNVRVVVSVGDPVAGDPEAVPTPLETESDGHGFLLELRELGKGHHIHWEWEWG